jgi:translation elongation factor EF-1alpha
MILLFRGPIFVEYLDSLPSLNRSIDGPLRILIVDRYKVCFIYIKLQSKINVYSIGNGCSHSDG